VYIAKTATTVSATRMVLML